MNHNLILITLLNFLFGLAKAQVVEFYQPIVITQKGDSIVDNKKVDRVIIDFYKTEFKSMNKYLFRYDYENSIVTF